MVISGILIVAGTIFLAIAALGVIRFPDFYTRLHAAGVGDTLGLLLVTLGMMVYTGFSLMSVKILLIFLFVMLTNPLGTNLISIATMHESDYLGIVDMSARDTKKSSEGSSEKS